MESKENISEYYDNYTVNQKKIGVSVRHKIIFNNLKKNGLKRNSKVLEIGCGIGTVSSLIIKFINKGKFIGCDISPKSIEIANFTLNKYKNNHFICSDMSNFEHPDKFDFIVFPDVLEHIPVDQHKKLFENISKVCHHNTKLIINLPEPKTLNFVRKNKPELLQIIDQSLSMQELLNNTYPFGFYLEKIIPYSIHTAIPNYLEIVFTRNNEIDSHQIENKLKQFIFNTKVNLKYLLK